MKKQNEWKYIWEQYEDTETTLFDESIAPLSYDFFKGKDILDSGCGGGQHLVLLAPYAKSLTGVDLNSVEAAKKRTQGLSNVDLIEDDITTMELNKKFDIVLCLAVLQHTDSPRKVFENLCRHCKPGGMVITWAYSFEGNFILRNIVESLRQGFFRKLPHGLRHLMATLATLLLSPLIYTFYKIPFFSFPPYFGYFNYFRSCSFKRQRLSIFDKLNAPQTSFLKKEEAFALLAPPLLDENQSSIRMIKGYSYAIFAQRRPES